MNTSKPENEFCSCKHERECTHASNCIFSEENAEKMQQQFNEIFDRCEEILRQEIEKKEPRQ